jgi:hypothetical protein
MVRVLRALLFGRCRQGFFYPPLAFYRRPAVWRYAAVYR